VWAACTEQHWAATGRSPPTSSLSCKGSQRGLGSTAPPAPAPGWYGQQGPVRATWKDALWQGTRACWVAGWDDGLISDKRTRSHSLSDQDGVRSAGWVSEVSMPHYTCPKQSTLTSLPILLKQTVSQVFLPWTHPWPWNWPDWGCLLFTGLWTEAGESFAADLTGFESSHKGSLSRQFTSRVSSRAGCVPCLCPPVQSTGSVLKAQLLPAAPRGLQRTSERSQLRCSRSAATETGIRQGALSKASLPKSDLGSLKPSRAEGSFQLNCC